LKIDEELSRLLPKPSDIAFSQDWQPPDNDDISDWLVLFQSLFLGGFLCAHIFVPLSHYPDNIIYDI
jgi:hypothetical protein